jgi:acetylornithine aminotransferase
MPIGACLASGKAADLLQPGNHGSTFGGNPLACAAALATINTIQADGLLDRATVVGKRIMSGLRSELAGVEHVKDIRGLGCMIGIELNKPCKSLFGMAMSKGLIINVTAESVIRLLPPFIMTDDEADLLVAILAPLIKAFNKD